MKTNLQVVDTKAHLILSYSLNSLVAEINIFKFIV